MFIDRVDAGKQLAKSLVDYKGKNVVVLGIPRGGVVIAKEVAKALNAPMGLVLPRKIGAPGNPELAIGALASKDTVMINEQLKNSLRVSDNYIKEEIEKQVLEIKRRRDKYLSNRPSLDLKDKVVILVDDGLATGYTASVAIKEVQSKRPKKLILAVPVSSKDTYERLKKEVDELICLHTPEFFYAVGQFYLNFSQVSDNEVIEILKNFGTT
ncbi:phosphoribosyltransferase [Candidatus Oleimmundimicrobium sp.]|uniref:phosphoribosyltransferase n=1 Tax=Candidatus Oleimmundimicrobium sp. TaxID=3060597 RepID=UPI0027221A2F|nr:phosphoribosyltransferase [Candidatus Oleimmundimicrobium sp.]MDO8885788.1 phosphoribosyltransferase [Candidatus Oleimmundimicrobium sp.]